jgi:hypothetical protein
MMMPTIAYMCRVLQDCARLRVVCAAVECGGSSEEHASGAQIWGSFRQFFVAVYAAADPEKADGDQAEDADVALA